MLDFGDSTVWEIRAADAIAMTDRAHVRAGGSLCPFCGLRLTRVGICPHHGVADEQYDWAAGNRIVCDFFHRGIVPPRLPELTRFDWEMSL